MKTVSMLTIIVKNYFVVIINLNVKLLLLIVLVILMEIGKIFLDILD